jgi:predicted ATPase
LRALIDWSYELLGADERILFARLSVFAGGWTLPAAEVVCSSHDLALDVVLDLMSGLANKSLVAPDGNGTRYRMLETIRDYARDRLLERNESPSVRTRHRDYFVKLAEDAEPHLEGGPGQPAWLAQLDLEQDNLRAALGWGLENEEGTEPALRLCGAVYRFWAHRGHAREGRQWCDAALKKTAGLRSATARLKALHASGTLAWRHGDITAAQSLLREALALSRELGDRAREGRVLNNLGGVAIHQGDAVTAQACLEQAVTIHRETGNQTMEARVLNNLAALAINSGRFDDAQKPLERALALGRELGYPMEEATSLSHLGFLAQRRNELEYARGLHERALATAREFGVREFEQEEVRRLGEIALAMHEPATAATHFRDALSVCKELGNQHEIVLCLEAIATLLVAQRAYERAARLCGAADALRSAIATPRDYSAQDLYEDVTAQCRNALGEIAAFAANAAGRASSSDLATADALAWLDEPEG